MRFLLQTIIIPINKLTQCVAFFIYRKTKTDEIEKQEDAEGID